MARGFLQRARFERELKPKVDEDFRTGNLWLLGCDRNHPNVMLISSKLGPYDYHACMPFARLAFSGSPYIDAPLVKRAAVEVEAGIFYEGEWAKGADRVRMGRGV